MEYMIVQQGEGTLIIGDVQMRIHSGKATQNTAFLLGHLYRIQGGFEPVKTYVFEVAKECGDLETLKKAVDFFFSSLLDTEWYIKEVPRASLLFSIEGVSLFGKEMMEETYGTTGVV